MAGGAWHGAGPSTPSLRPPVTQSSHFGLKPFRSRFLDAATSRGMTGGVATFEFGYKWGVTVGRRNWLFSNHARFGGGGFKRAVFLLAMSPVLEPCDALSSANRTVMIRALKNAIRTYF